ncbi:MAG: hypothetical protein M0R50_11200 [Candidatus Cloacimonetes bacterium]|jgi:hypothetical protein|nr:hypothetical protein [Candidatus Cloacimonadota bacterium]
MAKAIAGDPKAEQCERCEVCKWWDLEKFGVEIGHDDRHTDENDKPVKWQGFCCRFPPQFVGSNIGDGESVPGWSHPVTSTHDHCGEFACKLPQSV